MFQQFTDSQSYTPLFYVLSACRSALEPRVVLKQSVSPRAREDGFNV